MDEPFEDEGLLGDEPSQEDIVNEEEGDGEELFGDDMEADYRPMPALDRYDRALMDDDEYSELSQGERVAAEAAMRKRDRAAGIFRDDRDLLYG